MCGFAGSLAFDGSPFRVTEPYVTRMRETLVHRGPDGSGTWVDADGRIGLGHRRLAIIDPSPAAAQPMTSSDGRLHLVFNGEIYNHAELRRELEALGHHDWRTDHSDTEVLLQAFRAWGIDCLERLRGMFAFALWDATQRELWLVRDRIGIKPLYYAIHHGRIVFASEIKALLADPDQERAVDEEALHHYLSFLATPAPQTLFRGIRKLAGGTWLRVGADGSVREQRWWDAWDAVTPLTGHSDADIAELVLDGLRESVRLRKVSDVPVGVFLSGGIDSSTNAALFAEGESQPIRTFTIGYAGDYASYRNETGYARRMAEAVGAEHHELLLTQDDLLAFLPRLIALQDEPIADPVCVPVYYLAKLARDHGVVVCQVGEGSDELFCGYEGWRADLRAQALGRLPVPAAAQRSALALLRAAGKQDTFRYEWLRRSAAGEPIFWSAAPGFTETRKQTLLGEPTRRRLAGLSSFAPLAEVHARFRAKAWETSDLNWMTYAELHLRLPELLLMRVDKMTMGAGVEARVPFLDHRFVELALGIPTAVKQRNGELKSILKRAIRGLIPDEMIDRPKQGFGVPVQEWFLDRLGEQARRDVRRFADQSGLLDTAEAMRVFDSGRRNEPWYLLNLALWWQEFVGRA
jgi:asparagine synthase (glutamine-hydrolysing)